MSSTSLELKNPGLISRIYGLQSANVISKIHELKRPFFPKKWAGEPRFNIKKISGLKGPLVSFNLRPGEPRLKQTRRTYAQTYTYIIIYTSIKYMIKLDRNMI